MAQNQPDPHASPKRRRLPHGWLVWVVLTLAGTAVYMACWAAGDVGQWAEGLKPLGNAIQTMVLPGWALLRVSYLVWKPNNFVGALVANGFGWGCWWAAGHFVLAWRRRLLGGKQGSEPPANPARRRLLVDAPMALAGLAGGGGVLEAAAVGPWRLRVVRYTVPIADLPVSLQGLRAVQISDTHLGPRIPSAYVRDTVAKAIALKPDVFLLTGDYIHNGVHFIAPSAELMRPLVATGRPVVGVLGNHDWYGDGNAMAAALRNVGVRMIDNDRMFLTHERELTMYAENGALCIAGFGDLLESVVLVEPALGGVDPKMPRLVLAHNPDTAEYGPLAGDGGGGVPRVDLMLCGHTHGGQVSLPFVGPPYVPSRYGHKYAGGLVQGPRFRVLVSRGVGMSLVPIRFNVPPELVEVTLVRA